MLRELLLVAFVLGGASVLVDGVTVDELAAQVQAQKTELQAQRTQLETQASELQAHKAEIHTLRREMETDRAEISARQSAQGVYFTAYLTDYLQNYEGIIHPFNPVSNVGGGFDPTTGMFRAPVAGVYMFVASAGTFGANHHINIKMVKGAYEVASAWVGSGGSDAMGTVQATVHLNAGEQVWLQSMQANSYYYHHSTGFTGVLIKAD